MLVFGQESYPLGIVVSEMPINIPGETGSEAGALLDWKGFLLASYQ